MKQTFTLLLSLVTFGLFGQVVADFENITLATDSYNNGSDGNGGFTSGSLILPNSYNPDWESWSGWAISNTTDTQTPGFTNQYSAITGVGYNGSENYAVTYSPGLVNLSPGAMNGVVNGFYITNSTYAYLSMQDGDSYAKKFGGEFGDDPDFFLLTIQKYKDGMIGTEEVEFYLADFRFADNSQDYILNTWEYVDLSPLGNADSLLFTLTSSDVGQFGMNTPAYFCLDNFEALENVLSTSQNEDLAFSVSPNPTTDFVVLDWPATRAGDLSIYDVNGKLVQQAQVQFGDNKIETSSLTTGAYFLKVGNEEGFYAKRLIVK